MEKTIERKTIQSIMRSELISLNKKKIYIYIRLERAMRINKKKNRNRHKSAYLDLINLFYNERAFIALGSLPCGFLYEA